MNRLCRYARHDDTTRQAATFHHTPQTNQFRHQCRRPFRIPPGFRELPGCGPSTDYPDLAACCRPSRRDSLRHTRTVRSSFLPSLPELWEQSPRHYYTGDKKRRDKKARRWARAARGLLPGRDGTRRTRRDGTDRVRSRGVGGR